MSATSLNVKNIPTICIDGKIAFVSRIPLRDELASAVGQRIAEKSAEKKASTNLRRMQ